MLFFLGPYKGYGAAPASLGNGNGAKPNGELFDFFFMLEFINSYIKWAWWYMAVTF